ncbi:Crp/Fnr family transcriptional regulator [Chitinophaga silvatica]|uniref:Crp/Fnr family transcriptional regulator n=1 Tax=Chitinophaga silvatica TaxID=2282649 RepID=A0A3E1Y8M8_9BACT|nr:Crp/Fnr family transcriptional regulator [Chitinophaga silvatica]RFS21744.1 Crp/Fnr family transcriptional regulator [Chitinophaga silvatica]
MDSFLAFVGNYVNLKPEAKQALRAIIIREEFSKGHILTSAGTICRYIWFIEQGLARTFYIKDGKDVTDWISPENTISCSLVSFLTQRPDIRSIELLEPGIICALPYDELEKLFTRYHEIERLGRLLVNSGLILMQQRFDELHFSTARQRYQNLLATQPGLLNRVPLGMIASFLGITQETLSRMRKI